MNPDDLPLQPPIKQILHESTQREHSYARKKYRWHAQYSLDRADGIDQTNSPVTAELENLFLSIEDRRALYAPCNVFRLSSVAIADAICG